MAAKDDGPSERKPTDREMGRLQQLLLGLLLLALGVLLLYLVITLWPAVDAAKTNRKGTVTWFWHSYTLVPDATLLLLVVLISALGSYVHVTVSFSDFAGNRQLASSWMWWYLLRVFVGSSLAILFYFAIRGGFFSSATDSSQINVYGIAALSGLVGLFSKQATDKLREIFDTAFRTDEGYGDDARADGVTNPAPTLESSEPPHITGKDLELVLVGTGFNTQSIVTVKRLDGPDEPRTVKLLSPTRLQVKLLEDDIAGAAVLSFTVMNPEPGGGTSQPLVVRAEPAAVQT